MASAKKKRRRAAERRDTQPSSNGVALGRWIGPVGLLVVGLVVIAWQGGMFGDDQPDAPAGPAIVDKQPAPSRDRQPQVLTDSGEIRLATSQTWDELDDAASDGWDSEAFHLQVKKQLDQLGRLIANPRQVPAAAFSSLADLDFQCGPLRPAQMQSVFQDATIAVERGPVGAASPAPNDSPTFQGIQGLSQAIGELAEPLQGAKESHYEFKVVRVDRSGDTAETEQRLSFSGQTDNGIFEHHATWVTKWSVAATGKPRLLSIVASDIEQSRTNNSHPSLFVDCTDSALRDNECYAEQILRGLNHWLERIPFRTMLNQFGMPGVAVGDVNGDGREDLYLCQDPGVPNRLFLQNPDGTVREVSKSWGVDWLEDARSALLVDLDSDGDQDMVVAIQGHVVLAENDKQTRFRVREVLVTSEDLTSLVAFDFDMDGRLDIYACAYRPNNLVQDTTGDAIGAARHDVVVHDANNAAANSLFHNVSTSESLWKFSEVTEQVGLDVNNRRWSLAASAEDYDNDGDLDLYVANDFGLDNLYRNDVGADGSRAFVDVSEAANIQNSTAGMAITWGDYDRDGWMDAYVSNMWSAAGHRVTKQAKFMPESPQSVLAGMRSLAAGNTLLRNQKDGSFGDRSLAENVARGRWAWGNAFLDINNDGWEDLVVANGYITTEDTGDL